MKIKSLKGKIATGVITASLLATTGMAFANSNAGPQFKIWGDQHIQAAKDAVSSALGTATTN
ncbi:hypothetical protein, partial [Bacillus sp. FJAT-27445]|uniref:hypothetical protein n=1 Tax=Bacillus sp. FJAT-27445 TaxID=1679166 RepID=UPI000A5DB37A